MKKLLLKVELDIEPVTWGGNDVISREKLRKEIRDKIPGFDPQYIKQLLSNHDDIEVVLNCYLYSGKTDKDIDNLAKIPIDAVFFSAKDEEGYKNWERKITSLTMRKLQSSQNMLEIIVYGTTAS